MKRRLLFFTTIFSLFALIVVLQVTTPTQAGPMGILLVLALFYLSALGALTFLFYWTSRLVSRLAKRVVTRRPLNTMPITHAYYYASVVAFAPIMLIGMTSVGVLGTREVFLITVFVLLSCVYIRKRTA